MPIPPSPQWSWLGGLKRGLRRPDRWLDDPKAEFTLYLLLILLIPLFRAGLEQIETWIQHALGVG
jgi:hypothetical protein